MRACTFGYLAINSSNQIIIVCKSLNLNPCQHFLLHDILLVLSLQNPEMCQHLAGNVSRTMKHAIEVEEKIPLDQVRKQLDNSGTP